MAMADMRHRRRPPVSRIDHIDRPMSTGEVAAYLEVSRDEVYRCVRKGRIRAKKDVQCLYFDPKEILAFDGRLTGNLDSEFRPRTSRTDVVTGSRPT